MFQSPTPTVATTTSARRSTRVSRAASNIVDVPSRILRDQTQNNYSNPDRPVEAWTQVLRSPRPDVGFQTLKWEKIHNLTEKEREKYEEDKRLRQERQGRVLNAKKEKTASYDEGVKTEAMIVDSRETCTKDEKTLTTKSEDNDRDASRKGENECKASEKAKEPESWSPSSINVVGRSEATDISSKQYEDKEKDNSENKEEKVHINEEPSDVAKDVSSEPCEKEAIGEKYEEKVVIKKESTEKSDIVSSPHAIVDQSEDCTTENKVLFKKEGPSGQYGNDNVWNEEKDIMKKESSEESDAVSSPPTTSSILNVNQSTGLKRQHGDDEVSKEEFNHEDRPPKRARMNDETDASFIAVTNTIVGNQNSTAAIDDHATHNGTVISTVKTKNQGESGTETNVGTQKETTIKKEPTIKTEGG